MSCGNQRKRSVSHHSSRSQTCSRRSADLGPLLSIRSRSLEAEAEGRRHRERHSRSPALERSLPPPPTAKEQVHTPPPSPSTGVSVCLPCMASYGVWLGQACAPDLRQQGNKGRFTALSVLSACNDVCGSGRLAVGRS